MKGKRFVRQRSARQMRVIAVTGTSGKTTTAWLTAAVLAEAGLRVGVLSDLGCLGPDDDLPLAMPCGSGTQLEAGLSWLGDSGCSHAVVELPGGLPPGRLPASLAPDTVVVTNLVGPRSAPEGLGRRGLAAAFRVVRSLGPEGMLVTGCEAFNAARLARRLPAGCRTAVAGLNDGCDVRASAVEGGLLGRTVVVASGGQLVPLAVSTPTVSFVRDSLLAATVGGRYGIPLEVAVRAIEATGSVPGRVERLDLGQDTPLFLDCPRSGHAFGATLASLRRLTRGRLVVLAEQPLVERIGEAAFAPLVARHCDACVIAPRTVLADDPGDTDIAAYARIDRVLGSLGAADCGLVLGVAGRPGTPSGAPPGRFPLAMLVDAWLQISQAPLAPGRRAA